MRWIVGVDVGQGSHAALEFLAWAAGKAILGREDAVAVHVLEDDHLRIVLRTHHLDEVKAAAGKAAEETLERHGVDAPVEVVQAVEAFDGLAAEALKYRADALVVGRHAGLEGSGLARLGRIARGALRELAFPVIVVPHDLTPNDVGAGPVLALTGLGDDSIEAARFARRLATWMGRELVVAHAVEVLDGHREERVAEGRRALEQWVVANGAGADRLQIVEGSVVSGATQLATELGSPLLVTGSRRLSGIDRRLHASIGTELAASAPLAVAVVPPGPVRPV